MMGIRRGYRANFGPPMKRMNAGWVEGAGFRGGGRWWRRFSRSLGYHFIGSDAGENGQEDIDGRQAGARRLCAVARKRSSRPYSPAELHRGGMSPIQFDSGNVAADGSRHGPGRRRESAWQRLGSRTWGRRGVWTAPGGQFQFHVGTPGLRPSGLGRDSRGKVRGRERVVSLARRFGQFPRQGYLRGL